MHSIRSIIEGLLEFTRDYVGMEEARERLMENIFLFGIAIGLRRRLTPGERRAYLETLLTAEVLVLIEERGIGHPTEWEATSMAIAEALQNWLKEEPELREIFEEQFNCKLGHFREKPEMSPTLRSLLTKHLQRLSEACPEGLAPNEIPGILDRLEHPLDRA